MNLFALDVVNFVNPQIGFTHIFENTYYVFPYIYKYTVKN
jgi:hypothetical protein